MVGVPAFLTEGISTGYGRHVVSQHLSLSVERGSRTALVGPNGSGKSTTLKTLARLIEPLSGAVYLNGQDINRLPTRQVMLRRQDDAAIEEAIRMTRLGDFLQRPIDTLSGGERQRAWMALALAQRTEILLLDEPTTFLDVGHQLDLLQLVTSLNRDRGVTIVMVLHDLNHAARFSDRMIAMSGGEVVADGTPGEVLTPGLLRDCFGVEASVVTDPRTRSPMCIPYSPIHDGNDGRE